MPVYASTPAFADRRRHPFLIGAIVAGHVAVIAAVMAAKMEIVPKFIAPPTEVINVPLPPPPKPPEPADPVEPTEPRASAPAPVPPIVPIPQPDAPAIQPLPIPIDPLPGPIGNAIDPAPQPIPKPLPKADPVKTGPRFATSSNDVRPPYPESKRRQEEEASLRLRLTIDERGRVTGVEPVGRADPVFLEAARRHILARWRYQPATEDGRSVRSSTVVTLRFELDS